MQHDRSGCPSTCGAGRYMGAWVPGPRIGTSNSTLYWSLSRMNCVPRSGLQLPHRPELLVCAAQHFLQRQLRHVVHLAADCKKLRQDKATCRHVRA